MRNLLALLAAGCLVFLGLGWYLGWYKIGSNAGPDGHRQISIDVNVPKIQQDVSKEKQKVRDYLDGDKTHTPPPPLQPIVPTDYRTSDKGDFVFPEGFTPPPPLGSVTLPMPK